MTAADSSVRIIAAAVVVALYLATCVAVSIAQWRKRSRSAREAMALASAADDAATVLVAFASQTGTAQAIACQTAKSLHTAGVATRIAALSDLAAEDLRQADRALFVVSSYGEGDPPDNAALFSRRLMDTSLPLPDLHYGVLALGDRGYGNFCGFGVALERWLARQGAQALFERVDVDNADEAALRLWQHRLSRVAGTSDLPDWRAPAYVEWRLKARRLLNPGSAGGPAFHIELAWQAAGAAPHWEAGDLLQVLPPGDPLRPREYSIASVPADGCLHLLVRQERHGGGALGMASGWLTHEAQPGAMVKARLRAHANFRLADNARRPLILIGNGTGLAGLRSLLKARAGAGPCQNWLIYGERNAANDYYYRNEIEAWRETGVLERVNIVFSRDQAERRYVQHQLADSADAVPDWMRQGAAIYVCGSLQGMASGVDEVLTDILSRDTVDLLTEQGRYRRDVY